MKFYEFNENEKRIDIFNERWYKYPETGKFYRSVTTILGVIDKGYNYDEWLKNNGHNSEIIVDRAGRFGTEFHQLVESFLRGNEVKYYDLLHNGERVATELWGRFNYWIGFWKELNEKYTVEYKDTGIEYITYSDEYEFAGTIDFVCRLDGVLTIMDWKTGNNVGNKETLQINAYMQTIKADQGFIVHLPAKKPNKKGYRITEKKYSPELFDLFLSTKKVFDMENTDRPKVLTLPISISKEKL